MKRTKLSDEIKMNILIDHEKRRITNMRLSRKLGIDKSSVTKTVSEQRMAATALKSPEAVPAPDFQGVEIPDECLQSDEQKIAFYLGEAEKYKALSKGLEKKLGLLLRDRKALFSRVAKRVLEGHETGDVEESWQMDHDEFMEFFAEFGAT